MPELPEVETIKRGLNQSTLQQTIVGGEVLLPRTIAFPPDSSTFLADLRGCTIVQWHRRGKYLLAELAHGQEAGGWWGVHLRMTGQLLWLSPQVPLQTHTRVRLFFQNGQELRFVDIRTFGQMWSMKADRSPPEVIPTLRTLGPEPLSGDFSVSYFHDRLQHSHRPIKTALLDQSVVAGLGNIYADEALFLSQVHPTCPSDRLTVAQLKRLRGAIVQVLQTSIEHGGTTLRDFQNLEGINGNYGPMAWVYRRTGEHCRRCGEAIARIKLAGRSTHFCPHCQPLSEGKSQVN